MCVSSQQHTELKHEDGQFREDLFYRINVMTLLIPPLRERGSDVQQLADAILQRTCRLKAPTMVFSEEASQFIADHSWPGDVREKML